MPIALSLLELTLGLSLIERRELVTRDRYRTAVGIRRELGVVGVSASRWELGRLVGSERQIVSLHGRRASCFTSKVLILLLVRVHELSVVERSC